MKFNEGALAYLKYKKKLSADEMFAFGFLIGTQHSYASIIQNNTSSTEREALDAVDKLITNEDMEAMWDKIAVELELDLRPLYQIIEDTKKKV